MNDQLFQMLFTDVISMLREKLHPHLFYHSPEHTIDVIQSAERIAVAEHCSPDEIRLLKTASLFHDTGYVRDMREHEKHGCEIATELLTSHRVDPSEITVICGLIMATKVPQVPKTKLEEIICDADLDYLGRDDYFAIAESLYREFLYFEKIKNEKDWINLQVKFIRSHTYFTQSSISLRQPVVEENLKKIMEAVAD